MTGEGQWHVTSKSTHCHPPVLGAWACIQHMGCCDLGPSWGWEKQLLANTISPRQPHMLKTSSAKAGLGSNNPRTHSRDETGGSIQCRQDVNCG